jgi:hypothetical protein
MVISDSRIDQSDATANYLGIKREIERIVFVRSSAGSDALYWCRGAECEAKRRKSLLTVSRQTLSRDALNIAVII